LSHGRRARLKRNPKKKAMTKKAPKITLAAPAKSALNSRRRRLAPLYTALERRIRMWRNG
jgi:hypothetical protein